VEIATIICNRRTASLPDYRGGSLTLRRRRDETEARFLLRVRDADCALRLARGCRRDGHSSSDAELHCLAVLAGMVLGGSPYH
jgi:hypothetical protein